MRATSSLASSRETAAESALALPAADTCDEDKAMIRRVGAHRGRKQCALAIVLAIVAGCTNTHAGATHRAVAPTVSSTSANPRTTALELRATKSFSYSDGPRHPLQASAARLVVSKDVSGRVSQEVTLLFPRPSFKVQCVVEAHLLLRGVSVPGEPADLGFFPSAAFGFATGQTPEVPALLLDNQPAGHATATRESANVSVDVTSLVRTWLQGTFPSLGKRVPRSLPILLTVQPPD